MEVARVRARVHPGPLSVAVLVDRVQSPIPSPVVERLEWNYNDNEKQWFNSKTEVPNERVIQFEDLQNWANR